MRVSNLDWAILGCQSVDLAVRPLGKLDLGCNDPTLLIELIKPTLLLTFLYNKFARGNRKRSSNHHLYLSIIISIQI